MQLAPRCKPAISCLCSGKCWVINPCALVLACWRPDFCLALWMHCSQVQLLISCLWPETISHKPLLTVAWLAWRPALLSPAEKGALEWLIWDIQIEWLLKIILIPCQLVKGTTHIIRTILVLLTSIWLNHTMLRYMT